MVSRGERPSIAVVHLVREVYGTAPFRRFLESYRKHRAGIPHDLVFLCKGFRNRSLGDAWHELLGGVPFRELHLPDVGMDIPSYFVAARRLEHATCASSTPGVESWLTTGSRCFIGMHRVRRPGRRVPPARGGASTP
jgi:hypothetical protein